MSYRIGEIVGEIKIGKKALDIADEAFPGIKRIMLKSIANKTIDAVFGSE